MTYFMKNDQIDPEIKAVFPIFAPLPFGGWREVVQPGRIPGLGPGGRRFESCPPDN